MRARENFKLCLISRKFEEKYKGNKIGIKNKRKNE